MTRSGPTVVLTGATGFIGSRVLSQLLQRGASVMTLGRRRPAGEGHRFSQWDIGSEAFPAGVLDARSVVVHLAAATGTARPDAMARVNVTGVRDLVDAATRSRVAHLILVSSIAAAFDDLRWYPYGRSKRLAEQTVLSAGIPATVVRPTMVFGEGSPVVTGLRRLALLPVPVVPGRAGTMVQPLHVDDLARFLTALALGPVASGRVLEVGGPERITITDLLGRIRHAAGRGTARVRQIPTGLVRPALAMVERVSPFRLPVTSGQLASFVNDSVARPDELVTSLLPAPRGIAEMLASPGRAT